MRTKRSRRRPIWIVSQYNRFKWGLDDLKHAKANADIAHSARYLLGDMNHTEGIKKIAEVTGLPEGVCANALDKFSDKEEL